MFGLKLPKMGGGAAHTAFKGADLSGKLGLIGSALGDDPSGFLKMISPLGAAATDDPTSLSPLAMLIQRMTGGHHAPEAAPGAGQDQAVADMIGRMQGDSGLMQAPGAQPRPRFGFGFRHGATY